MPAGSISKVAEFQPSLSGTSVLISGAAIDVPGGLGVMHSYVTTLTGTVFEPGSPAQACCAKSPVRTINSVGYASQSDTFNATYCGTDSYDNPYACVFAEAELTALNPAQGYLMPAPITIANNVIDVARFDTDGYSIIYSTGEQGGGSTNYPFDIVLGYATYLKTGLAYITSDNKLFTTGWGGYGTTGQGTIISATQVGSLTNWRYLAGNGGTLHAIKTDGTLWGWGRNNYGNVGNLTTDDVGSPVQIGTATWKYVSTDSYNSAGITTDGKLWTWGRNTYGQLGDSTTANKSSPIQVGTATDWDSVNAGGQAVWAIKTDGTLWSWGYNINAVIGDGTTTNRSSPVKIGTLTNWKQVVGNTTVTAVKTDNTLWTWGVNYNYNTTTGQNSAFGRGSPIQVGSLSIYNRLPFTKGYYGYNYVLGNDRVVYYTLGQSTNGVMDNPYITPLTARGFEIVVGAAHQYYSNLMVLSANPTDARSSIKDYITEATGKMLYATNSGATTHYWYLTGGGNYTLRVNGPARSVTINLIGAGGGGGGSYSTGGTYKLGGGGGGGQLTSLTRILYPGTYFVYIGSCPNYQYNRGTVGRSSIGFDMIALGGGGGGALATDTDLDKWQAPHLFGNGGGATNTGGGNSYPANTPFGTTVANASYNGGTANSTNGGGGGGVGGAGGTPTRGAGTTLTVGQATWTICQGGSGGTTDNLQPCCTTNQAGVTTTHFGRGGDGAGGSTTLTTGKYGGTGNDGALVISWTP